MSDTVFLDPVAPNKKIVFIQIRNTSDKPDLNLTPNIAAALSQKGYTITEDPDKAQFFLQANILSVAKTANNPISNGFGSYGAAITGAGVGALASAATGGTNRNAAGAALAVGALAGLGDLIGNALVKDVYYSIITDVQIQQRNKAGVVTSSTATANAKTSASSSVNQVTSGTSDMKTYQTRVISVANQANLEFNDAIPSLQSGLTQVISGVFWFISRGKELRKLSSFFNLFLRKF